MAITSKHISYHKTGYFSPLVLDYITQNSSLFSLPLHTPDLSGLKKAIEQRQQFPTDRTALVAHLKSQYEGIELLPSVRENIERLSLPSTFYLFHPPVSTYRYPCHFSLLDRKSIR